MMVNEVKEIKESLLGKSKAEIEALLLNEKKFVSSNIYSFLMDGKDFSEMTSLRKDLREKLSDEYVANPVQILEKFVGKLGTIKYLFKLQDNNLIEGVFMPHNYGNTLCLSTQIGCRMRCKFCASGLDGLVRCLTVGEMLGQVIAVNRDNGGTSKDRKVTNLVLMGSGEPFDNYDNVLTFLDRVSEEGGINISERNISLSTSGLVEKIRKFADSGHKVTLSISLHAPFNDLRSSLMPVNKSNPIEHLISAAKYYFNCTGRRVIFEYTLIKDENDSDECAKELAKLTKGFPSHINLIRLNEVKEHKNLKTPSELAAEEFVKKLEKLGVSVTIRKSLGNDIEGACGQLRRRYLEDLENR